MNPPNRGSVTLILDQGRKKYGWCWLIDEEADWWGAKADKNFIIQVKPKRPDFPTRRWNETVGGGYNPVPQLLPLRDVIVIS